MSSEFSHADLADALRNSPPGDDCPDDGTLFEGARGNLRPELMMPILDHVSACGLCAQSWSLARRALHEEGSQAIPQTQSPANRIFNFPIPIALGIAAATILTLSVSLISSQNVVQPEREPTFREQVEVGLTSSIDQVTAPVGTPLTLTWDGPNDAVYQVVVTTADLKPVDAARGIPSTRYVVPGERLSQQPGTVLHWRVVGQRPDGQLLQSPTFEVTLADED